MASTGSTPAALSTRVITAARNYHLLLGFVASLPFLLLAVFNGVQDKPVAEDFLNPRAFLAINDHSLFRPGFALPFMAIEHVFGRISENPVPYHVYSLMLHIAVISAVFWVAQLLTERLDLAVAVATIFALYPRNHEVVYWPAAAAHPMMTLFLLLSFGFAIVARETDSQSKRLLSIGFFAISLFSHEAAGVLIPILVVYSLLWQWDRHRPSLRMLVTGLLRQLWPYVVISAAYGCILIIASTRPSQFTNYQGETSFYHLVLRVGILRDFGGYISYTTLPFVHLRSIEGAVPKMGLLLLAVAILSFAFFIGGRVTRFGIAWIVLTTLPFAVFVPFGNADRYFYLPAVGWSLVAVDAAAAVIFRANKRRQGSFAAVVSAVLVLVAVVYVFASFVEFQNRRNEWQSAGNAAASLLNQIYTAHPTVSPQAQFYFLNMPDQYSQARFMSIGLGTELKRHYGESSITVNSSSDPDVMRAVQPFGPGQGPDDGVYVYQYARNSFVDRSSSFEDPNVRSMLEERSIPKP